MQNEDIRKVLVLALSSDKLTTTMLQRQLRFGYGKAARMIDVLEEIGIIDENHEVLVQLRDGKILEPNDDAGEEFEIDLPPTEMIADVNDKFEIEEDDYKNIVKFVVKNGQCSTALLQRKFGIGFSKAMYIVSLLEKNGIIGPQNGARPRQALLTIEELRSRKNEK
jgi:DNA segregation ATPase FtsK/SpoIIIE-like protein